ncbi:hypothetical protein BGZ70_002701 [Mortierella alpina]|uniref:Uncharacterized protein n=1 Tax=Mortierella alpina TaxID=64518 RepID=A0A9P6IVC5_MORAP|nr:hypothetical protein BGZ70_002701 [Mortierella alpina]
MIIPPASSLISTSEDNAAWAIAISTESSVHPTIVAVFLLILVVSLLLARCLYVRFKTMHSPSSLSSEPTSSSWKNYYGSRYRNQNNNNNEEGESGEDDGAMDEQERLLARRRSTSYYDANRSRAPVAVVVRQDSKGRPISTWSTASSVAAQRGEELSNWSRRRDDLLRIYGRSQINSYADDEDLVEEEDAELEPEQQPTEGAQDDARPGA